MTTNSQQSQNKPSTNQQVASKLSELYISLRTKYLIQLADGKYNTLTYTGQSKVRKLNDGYLQSHLKGDRTYGIYVGNFGTKFMTLDVDMNKEDGQENSAECRMMVYRLVNTLIEEFNVAERNIHVSVSGSKGYHIDLFFPFISREHVNVFYDKIIKAVGCTKEEVELRPTNQGVKLPLGIHQKTKRRCWFVDTIDLTPIESMDHILSIEPMTEEEFLFSVYGDEGQPEVKRQIAKEKSLETRQKKLVDFIAASTDMEGRTADEAEVYAQEVLGLGRLKFPDSRHNTTLLLARYFNTLGNIDRQSAIDTICAVIDNTDESFFDSKKTVEFRHAEVERLVNYAYDRNYTLVGSKQNVTVTRNEILQVLRANTLAQKQTLFAMLVHSKRYAKKDGTFYMTYDQLTEMTGFTNRRTMKKNLERLQADELLQIVASNVVDKVLTKELGELMKKPNVYKLLVDVQENDVTFEIDTQNIEDFMVVVQSLVSLDEVKGIVGASQFKMKFKPFYEAS
jgi:hypothetical protein